MLCGSGTVALDMDGYQPDELFDGSPLQTSSSSSESGDSEPKADSSRDKHIEFM